MASMHTMTRTANRQDAPPPNPGTTRCRAGTARADITDRRTGPVHDPLYARVLILQIGETSIVFVSVDAVAFGQIGRIPADYVAALREHVQRRPGFASAQVLASASHCHGSVCPDVESLTLQAIDEACNNLQPVRIGSGRAREDRIMINRRIRLKDGSEADERHAYALPPDERVDSVGPIDPEIGILRILRPDDTPLAVLYTLACHPIQGVPGGGNTADLSGFASRAIEESLGHGAIALFLQGCAGDVNPLFYKDVDHPRDAEPLGNLLGLSVLKALHGIACRPLADLRLSQRSLRLPRADLAAPIAALEAEQIRLLESLQGTTLNLKAFMNLAVKHGLAETFPSAPAHLYLHQRALGRTDLERLDAENRRAMERYRSNVLIMEQLTRVRTNLGLLRLHQEQNQAAAEKTLTIEVLALKIGDLALLTFPGELSVQIGLDIKAASPHSQTYVATCTNGYIYYAPTAQQLRNRGKAQEDTDCLLAPEWETLFRDAAQALLESL